MKKLSCSIAVVLAVLPAFPHFASAYSYYDMFKPEHVTWKLDRYEIWADVHTYHIKGELFRLRNTIAPAAYGREMHLTYQNYYSVDIEGTYKPKELSFEEIITIRLIREQGYARGKWIQSRVPDLNWKITMSGSAGSDPWLWPSKAMIQGVSGQFIVGGRFESPDHDYAQFTFPLPLSFNALTEAQRKPVRTEESSAILSPCPNMYDAPVVKSPASGEVFVSKRLHMSFEVDCRYNDYRSNGFEVELQWYEPVEMSDPKALQSRDGDFRAYPNKPVLFLDMRPNANQYEIKSWGSGYLDFPIEGRYRLRARAQVAGELNNASTGMSSSWSEWQTFWSGKITAAAEEAALRAVPDLVPASFESRVIEPGQPKPGGADADRKYYYFAWIIRNAGGADAPESRIGVECFPGNSAPCPADSNSTFTFEAVAMGEERTFAILHPVPGEKVAYQFRATVDYAGEILEGSEENNVFISAFASEGPVPVQGAGEWLERGVAAGSGQEEMSVAAKGAFGSKVLEKSGKEAEPPPGMKESTGLAKKPLSMKDRMPAGAASLSRDQRMKALKKGMCVLGFEPLSVSPKFPKAGEPFELVIPFRNTGSDECLSSQEYSLFCHVDSGKGPCPFREEDRKLGRKVQPGETVQLKMSGATAPRGKYTVKVGPKVDDGGNFQHIYLTVGPVVDPSEVDAALQQKSGVDAGKVPKEMQQKETEDEGVKVPSSGLKMQSK